MNEMKLSTNLEINKNKSSLKFSFDEAQSVAKSTGSRLISPTEFFPALYDKITNRESIYKDHDFGGEWLNLAILVNLNKNELWFASGPKNLKYNGKTYKTGLLGLKHDGIDTYMMPNVPLGERCLLTNFFDAEKISEEIFNLPYNFLYNNKAGIFIPHKPNKWFPVNAPKDDMVSQFTLNNSTQNNYRRVREINNK